MKTYLSIPIALLLLCSHAFAANPAFTDFYGTNGIIIRTNGNKVQVDGSALASSNILANANIWTNTGSEVFITFHTNRLRLTTNIIYGAAIRSTQTNTVLGFNALRVNTEENNVAIGTNAMGESVTGYQNIAIGDNVLRRDTSAGGENVAVGHNAMAESVGGYWTVAIGEFALANSIDGFQNVAVGKDSLANSTNVSDTVAIGFESLNDQITGSSNVAIGSLSMRLNHSGTQNAVVGDTGMRASVVGSRNVAVGSRSLLTSTNDDNTAIGFLSGTGLLGGRENVFVGSGSGVSSTQLTNAAALGAGAKAWLNSQMVLGTNITNYVFRNVDYNFPAAQGDFDSFLKNDGGGTLSWSTNLSLLVVTNLNVINTTVMSNVTVRGNLIITNITMGGANLRTNQYTTNISGTPVVGSLWFDGTDFGTFVTNGQRRASVEWIPINQSLRVGAVGNIGVVHHNTLNTSNFWDSPNVGRFTYVFGSNNLANAQFCSVLGGFQNVIYTNASNAVIVAGFNNTIKTNAHSSVISGGLNNHIHVDANTGTIGGGSANEIQGGSTYGTIGGGASHIIQSTQGTVGGGSDNVIATSSSSSTISGGRNNRVNSSDSFIGGGHINQIRALGAGATIAGGDANDIGGAVNAGSTYSFIGGGSANVIDGFGNTTGYGVIAGGQQNHIEAGGGWNTIGGGFKNDIAGSSKVGCIIDGGISNLMTGNFAAIMGNYITNSQDKAIEIGFGSEGGNNRKLRVDGNGARVMTYNGSATVGGTYLITNTVVFNAGSAETNLQVVTIGAHVLTNNNDRLLVRGSGRFAATSNTKQIQLMFGSEDVFDSGAFVANTGAWTLDCEIIRTGNTNQSCNCSFNGGTNTVYVRTSSLDLVQTNGIATVLKITGTASGNGDITNRTLTVEWRPST